MPEADNATIAQIKTFFSINLIILVLYGVPAMYILIKNKFKLEYAIIINISLYCTSFFIKTLIWTFMLSIKKDTSQSDTLQLMEVIASYSVEVSTYFFVFEMMFVYSLIQSTGPSDSLQRF